jgi:hypothetical protein
MDRRIVTSGTVSGAVASVAMGMLAMVAAATYQHTGFFTPLYHIASPIIGTDTLMRSMGTTYLSVGPALLGLAVHMMVGAFWGTLFVALARSLRITGPAAVAAGAAYGVAVMFVMALLGLPATAAILRGGEMVRDMASLVGWGTFTAEHVLFGAVLGIAWAWRGQTAVVSGPSSAVHAAA